MTTAIAHVFTSAKADGPDATLVQPGDWNANHNPFLSMTNRSGAAVVQYDACAVGTANDDSFTTTTTQYDTRPLVVVAPAAGIANATAGTVQNLFQTVVNVQGNVTRGNWLRFSATAGRLEDAGIAGTSAAPHGANAIAVTGYAGGGAGTVTAMLRGVTAAILPGGTVGVSGGVPYFDSTTSLLSSVALTANRLVLGGGAGAGPTVLGSLGTTTTVLHGNAAGAPTFAAVSLTADVSGILPTAAGGTGIAYFTAAGPTVARVYTFPDAAATVLTTDAAVTVAQGGTNATTAAAARTSLGLVIGTDVAAQSHAAASDAVHGLPASVSVLGNRSAAGEFIQRGTYNPAAANAGAGTVYPGSDTITWTVAFAAAPYAWHAGFNDHGGALSAAFTDMTTTTGNLNWLTNTSAANPTTARWVALST